MADYLTPEMFGAVGNNLDDDSNAFAQMIASLGSRGGQILIPPKEYYLANDFIINKNSVAITATGSRYNSSGTVLRFAPNKGVKFDGADSCSWNGGRLYSSGDTDTSNGKGLLVIGKLGLGGTGDGATGNVFQNLDIEGGIRALHLGKSLSNRFYSCRFLNETGSEAVLIGNGLDADWGVDAPEFYSCNFSGGSNSSTGVIRANGKAHSIKLTGCAILNGGDGLVLQSPGTAGWSFPKFISVIGGGFENGMGVGINAYEGDDIRVVGAYVSTDGSSDGIWMQTSFDGQLVVDGSTIRGNGRNGVRASGGRLIVSGSKIINNGFKTTGDGIRLDGNTNNWSITGNYIGSAPDGTNNQRYGVVCVGKTASEGAVSGNRFNGNNTSAFGNTSGAWQPSPWVSQNSIA